MSGPELTFDNSFARELPADPLLDNRSRKVRDVLYSKVTPTKVSAPSLLAWSTEVGAMLGVGETAPEGEEAARWARILSGNEVLPGMLPIATRYGGHQFGSWAGQLGDGRAISLGEVMTRDHGRLELQLKGAGRTPYSRTADGRAVLRSSIREYVCSEAMHHLGVPTTRALSLVGTGDAVLRDMFYDGNAENEPGAIVCRVAPTFLRFGHFEMLADDGEVELLGKLFSYTVRHHFPALSPDASDPEAVLALFREVAARTARLVVDWQRVGFVHGVMNTDNLSILGVTIDYGPYGFLEPYDPGWTPNTTDAHGRRYRYGNQPQIALWNLERLAESLGALIVPGLGVEKAQERLIAEIDRARELAFGGLRTMLGHKMGIADAAPEDEALILEGLSLMQAHGADYVLFFRRLADVVDGAGPEVLADVWYDRSGDWERPVTAWLERLKARQGGAAQRAAMNRVNPIYVPRNWLAQEAIDAATAGDLAPLHRLNEVLRSPYDERPEHAHYAEKRPDWAKTKPGCAMLSCSS
jgi:serine/tyrosine/threonine adenylyltransferase